MDEVTSLKVRNRMVASPQSAGQIETRRPPDPILRRPCTNREEKRVTHGHDMRSDERDERALLEVQGGKGVQCREHGDAKPTAKH
jgi:hypothetical protein